MGKSRRQVSSAQLLLPLDAESSAEGGDVGLLCAFGNTGRGWNGKDHCSACHAQVNADVGAFLLDVQKGKYNARGYTTAEWKYFLQQQKESGIVDRFKFLDSIVD